MMNATCHPGCTSCTKKNHDEECCVRHHGFRMCNTQKNQDVHCPSFRTCNTQIKPRWQAQLIVLVLQVAQRKNTMMTNTTFVVMVSKLVIHKKTKTRKCCTCHLGFRTCNTQKKRRWQAHKKKLKLHKEKKQQWRMQHLSSWFQSFATHKQTTMKNVALIVVVSECVTPKKTRMTSYIRHLGFRACNTQKTKTTSCACCLVLRNWTSAMFIIVVSKLVGHKKNMMFVILVLQVA
jgi:hypothetical protein